VGHGEPASTKTDSHNTQSSDDDELEASNKTKKKKSTQNRLVARRAASTRHPSAGDYHGLMRGMGGGGVKTRWRGGMEYVNKEDQRRLGCG